jgi:hypothetical protein
MTVTERPVPSSDSERKLKRRGKPDHRGDHRGVIDPAGTKTPNDRDNIVSARWVAHAMRQSTEDLDRLDAEGADFAWLLEFVGKNSARSAAMALAMPALWRARKGRVTVGELMDLGDLFANGRGTVDQLVADLIKGKYADLTRDDDGFLILEPDAE